MMKKQIVIIILMLSLRSNLLIAQDSSHAANKWDLQTCIEYAKRNNIQINSIRLNSLSSEQQLLLAKAAKLPGASGAASQYYTHSNNTNPVVGGFQTQSSLSGNYSINTSWVLYNGGYNNLVINQNQLLLESSKLNVLQTENNITIQIAQSYLNILEAKENIVFINDLLTTSQAQLKQAQQQYDAGSIALKDLASLRSQLASDNYTLVNYNNALKQNELVLKQLLQLPVDTTFDVQEPDTLMAISPVQSLRNAENTAAQIRPEIKIGEVGVHIARLGLLEAKALYRPTVSFSGALSSGYSNDQTNAYLKQINSNFYQTAGLNLSVPIFTKRVLKTNVELAKINILQADLSLKNVKTNLSQAVEQAYLNVQNAEGQYDASIEQKKATAESYRISADELKVGAINIVDYLIQKNLYVQALQAYTQAKYNVLISIKIYDFYTGVPIKL